MSSTAADRSSGHALARSLLDGLRPVTPATREAVDAALCGGSTDRALHAAALWLAFTGDGDLGLTRSKAKRWILGLDELIDSGHVDAAAYACHRLHAAYPRAPYLEHMDLVFRLLPPPPGHGRPPFVDVRDEEVQTATMPGSDTVILAFCGARNRIGLAVSLMDRWFAQLGSHIVYLRDPYRVGFIRGVPALGRDMPATVEGLRALVQDLGARRVVCTGNSAGASGALRYAPEVGAERVLALAPITGGRAFVQMVIPSLPPGAPMPWTDLVPLYLDDVGPQVRIMYGEKNEGDRQQARRMIGLPNVTVEAVPDLDSHHLIGALLRAGQLEPVLRWLIADGSGTTQGPTG